MSVTHATTASDPQTPRLGATDWNADHTVSLTAADVGAVPTTRTVTAGTGLTGGGALSGNITLNVAGLTVRQAAGVPSGAPTGTELPIAFDTTSTTGGLYVWSGAAWILASTIPPVITPS